MTAVSAERRGAVGHWFSAICMSTSRRSCARCSGYPTISESRSSWQRLSTSAWTARPWRTWLTAVGRLATVAPEWDQRRPGYYTCRARDPHTEIIFCRRTNSSGTACYTRSVTVQSRFQETAQDRHPNTRVLAQDSRVWMTIAALVRLNWDLLTLHPLQKFHQNSSTFWVMLLAERRT